MRDYATVKSAYWTGETGRKLRAIGRDEQLLGVYLITCPSSNMLGLYYLPVTTIAHELGMDLEGASKALRRVCETGFCQYDEDAEQVWVLEMAAYQIGDRLSPGDNRVKAIHKMLEGARKSRLFPEFIARYGAGFHWSETKPLRSPSQAPSKPLRSQEQEQEQEQEQNGAPRGGRGAAKPLETNGKPKASRKKKPLATYDESVVPSVLQTPEFLSVWKEWFVHRSEIGRPMTPTAARQALGKCSDLGPHDAITALREAMANGWQGFAFDGRRINNRQSPTAGQVPKTPAKPPMEPPARVQKVKFA